LQATIPVKDGTSINFYIEKWPAALGLPVGTEGPWWPGGDCSDQL